MKKKKKKKKLMALMASLEWYIYGHRCALSSVTKFRRKFKWQIIALRKGLSYTVLDRSRILSDRGYFPRDGGNFVRRLEFRGISENMWLWRHLVPKLVLKTQPTFAL
jgi:hypothetical protein